MVWPTSFPSITISQNNVNLFLNLKNAIKLQAESAISEKITCSEVLKIKALCAIITELG
jgi:hypothetical protein